MYTNVDRSLRHSAEKKKKSTWKKLQDGNLYIKKPILNNALFSITYLNAQIQDETDTQMSSCNYIWKGEDWHVSLFSHDD